jgi:hypothetical protein
MKLLILSLPIKHQFIRHPDYFLSCKYLEIKVKFISWIISFQDINSLDICYIAEEDYGAYFAVKVIFHVSSDSIAKGGGG